MPIEISCGIPSTGLHFLKLARSHRLPLFDECKRLLEKWNVSGTRDSWRSKCPSLWIAAGLPQRSAADIAGTFGIMSSSQPRSDLCGGLQWIIVRNRKSQLIRSKLACALGTRLNSVSCLLLQVVDIPTPIPGPGEILVKIGGAGACHSDLHVLKHGRRGAPPQFTLGHENAGWGCGTW